MSYLQKYTVLLVFALFLGIFFSCNRLNNPKKEISDPVFAAVLVDAFMAEAYVGDAANTKSFNAAGIMNRKVYPVLLKKHGVDSAQFDHTFEYFLHHAEEFRVLLTGVQDTLNAIAAKAPVSNEVIPQPATNGPIESDSALARDAMRRLKIMQKSHSNVQNGGAEITK